MVLRIDGSKLVLHFAGLKKVMKCIPRTPGSEAIRRRCAWLLDDLGV